MTVQFKTSNFHFARSFGVVVAGILFVLYVSHVKSIWNQLPPNFEWGFYAAESEGGQPFRWTRGLALKTVERDRMPTMSVKALNPDIGEKPLKVRIYGNSYELRDIELADSAWHAVEIPLKRELPAEFVLGIKPSRTWSPAALKIAPDYRELGVMVRF